MKIKAGIIGAAGYTGGELLRILLNHPGVDLVFAQSRSNGGQPVYDIHTDLMGNTNMLFSAEMEGDIDVLFLCMAHGEAAKFILTKDLSHVTRVIDLSQDFRYTNPLKNNARDFVYGLPELNKVEITEASNIANPGCFATAIQLAMLPLAKQGCLQDAYVTGITGSTGAGQSLSPTSHFSWRNNNVQAYKSLSHQHMEEITSSFCKVSGQRPSVNFVPWRGDFTRGIYVSAVMASDMHIDDLYMLYSNYYKGAAFTFVSEKSIDLKQVVNTNKCLLHIEKENNKVVVHSVIDNLLKGASGQAVQNMNLMFGQEENAGLKLKASVY